MELHKITSILWKRLLGKGSEEEIRQLEIWKEGNCDRESLVNKVNSVDFLTQAVKDDNRSVRERIGRQIEMRVIQNRRKRMLRWVRGVAAVLIPVCCGLAVWEFLGKSDDGHLMVNNEVHAGTSRAVIELAGGEQIYLQNDTVLNLEKEGLQLVNMKDTLHLTGIQREGMDKGKGRFHVIRIPRGGEYIACLEDGSMVHLNSESVLKIPETFAGKNTREIWLNGEAYFEVAKDTKKPFVVNTDFMKVTVLGTHFNVNTYRTDGVVETTLVEGSVEVADKIKGNKVVLKPAEQARLDNGQLSVRKVDTKLYTSWVDGKFYFEREDLEEIVSQLERWYDVSFFFVHERLKERTFTGVVFRDEALEKVLGILEKTAGIRCSLNGRTVTVYEQVK